jgi:hypothetical protein
MWQKDDIAGRWENKMIIKKVSGDWRYCPDL